MKIITILSIIALIAIIMLTIYSKTVTDDKVRKRLSSIIRTTYLAVWIIFMLAYYFHNENVLARNASFDFGGIVLFCSIVSNMILWHGIYKKKKYIPLRILGVILLSAISCICIYLAPANAEFHGTISTFYSLPWYIYYLAGVPVAALHWSDD